MIQTDTPISTQVVTLQNDDWHAELALEPGANLYRLLHRPSGLEVLRRPRDLAQLRELPEHFGIPVLFPPNRIAWGRFRFDGRDYTLPINDKDRDNHIHGLVLRACWEVIEQGQDHVTVQYLLKATPGFPHDCRLQLKYQLNGACLRQKMTVTNLGDTTMPLGLGYHTAFTMMSDSQIQPTVSGKYWEVLNPQALPTGRQLDWAESDLPLMDRDQQPRSWHAPVGVGLRDGRFFVGAVISHESLGVTVVYDVDESFKHWYFWNGQGGQGFYCIEPLSMMADGWNMNLPTDVKGVQQLAPHASWSASTSIRVE